LCHFLIANSAAGFVRTVNSTGRYKKSWKDLIMNQEDKIALSTITVVNKAMMTSDDLETMCANLSQLLVTELNIKGCAIFILNPETQELEILTSFGLSIAYINKGPVLTHKSIANTIKGKPVIVHDINQSDKLQYPENARQEGIGAIVSLPLRFKGRVIGDMRLYHHTAWHLSEKDIVLLQCLSDHIGLAMTYTRLSYALQNVKEAVTGIHAVWF
jgi:transcriptional regulator with GAF, ATPase, and Fis domain